ncbi:unnamed protein product [Rotaria socialis]|uniref:Eukaryotic translation initiation factor 3 subunit I n=1 Tax=Rotaria socialis TaxID=392032 RepID=A0A817LYZ6_9BILA|nr:unnamed protein product [Rotaria socialis]CAF3339723.1 unnamed protein product [Rotaria socialis]CAF3343436.1 unnamed protein product [Rotaria socialis]CAF3371687.1 unnamed protein product [Rotaria socialis]CAF3375453.1 unnamed protein product [Rotaria socialis]
MRPILLQAHERSLTKIRYNREGDLLFSSGKDKIPCVWYSINGERLGTYNGHNGTVWTIDVNWDTTAFVSASADSTVRVWDVQTGRERNSYTLEAPARCCAFSYDGNSILYTNDDVMGKSCEMYLADIRMRPAEGPSVRINISQLGHRKVTSVLWGTLDQFIITGHDNGELVQWDIKTQEDVRKEKPHAAQIMDLQTNRDLTFFISSSKDCTAKLFDVETLDYLKTYTTDRPVNSAAMSPIKDHVVLGGGQEAIEVTQSAATTGKFEARFFHLIFEEEFARVKGHFGPINTLAFHPDGKSYASGGEDGFVRIHHFDNDYLDYDF